METIKILGPTIIAFATALVGLYKYLQEKNRQIYERRLNEVYAPLYGFLVAQETFRQLYLSNLSIKDFPILTLEKKEVKKTFSLTNGTITEERSIQQTGILDRKNFTNILDKTNIGLARTELLIAMKQYELLVYLKENTSKGTEEWNKATNKKVEIEYALFRAYSKWLR